MANIESVKVYFDTQKIEQTNEITDIKIVMLKGEKGDTVSAQWGTITGTLSNQEDLNDELTTMAGNISTNASDILSLNTRVGADESSISDIDGRVTTNTGDISTLDGKVTTNTSDISSLGSRVTTVETDMGNYDTRITTNTNNITELDGRVTTNTNNIAGLVVNTLTGDETTKAPSVKSVNTALTAKQDTLVSGTNIKTINSTSLLGSGNISIEENQVIVSPTEPTGNDRKKVWLQHTDNLFVNYTKITDANVNSSGTIQTDAIFDLYYISCKPSTTYVIKCGSSADNSICVSSTIDTPAIDVVGNTRSLGKTEVIYTTRASDNYLVIRDTKNFDAINNGIVIVEQGETIVNDKEYILNSNNVYKEFKKEEVIDITSLSGGASINSTYWRNRLIKQGKICHLELAFAPNSTSNITIYQLPAGFYSSGNTATIGLLMRNSLLGKMVITNGGAVQVQVGSESGNTWSLNATWVVD